MTYLAVAGESPQRGQEESWEGRWRQKSWWGRSWGKGDDMWAEG